ncbi:MAG: ABC transporter substrate-binding protein [Halobacteriovoraceae bacterium]|nr:ABC transporter substrate-binding protein [Halobacteriovoraceae bacterium]|tara:strand:+ start:236 stop:1204 length:969 start_codon:yes stop_codon:yes gene_type:complete
MKILTLFLFLTSVSQSSHAVKLKLATLVPKGTSWAKTLKEMSDEIKKQTDGKVKFQIYYGGVQGDEPDVLRKTRVGQLHGGIFTGKTLGDISSDVRAIELPFNFYHDEKKAMKVLDANTPYFNQKLKENGFINLGFYGIGKVYVVSTKKIQNIEQMKGTKMWAWEGDKVIQAMMESLGLVSVPLALPDVMSSLSTGMVESAYAPPLAILALQWQSKVKYLIDFPTAYTIGSLLIAEKRWSKVKPEHQKIVREIASKYVAKANEEAIKDNNKSLEELKSMGVEFIKFDDKDLAKAEKIREQVINKLKGSVLSQNILTKVEQAR